MKSASASRSIVIQREASNGSRRLHRPHRGFEYRKRRRVCAPTFASSIISGTRSAPAPSPAKRPALIYHDLNLIERILLRSGQQTTFRTIWVDSESGVRARRALSPQSLPAQRWCGASSSTAKDTPLYEEFGIQAELDKALKPKVWLKSGGYIVINQTEALVAVDVNTGKFVGKTNRLEDTIVKTNVDAGK
jgi:Rne/Rng family ribonuclease